MNIGIGADHRGFAHKEYIKSSAIFNADIVWFDVGTNTDERTDYPLYVGPVCDAIKEGRIEKGILVCGSGAGMAIAANRNTGIYAAVAWNVESARVSKQDDNTNVLVIPADFVSKEQSIEMIRAWLRAEFKGDRYASRLKMID